MIKQKLIGIVAALATIPVVILERDLTATGVVLLLVTLPLLLAKERVM